MQTDLHSMSMPDRTHVRLRTSLISALVISAMAGCNFVGPAAYFISGPTKVPAQFELPADRPAVVFVDDRGSSLPSRTTRQRISQAAERTLLDGKAVAKSEIISSNALIPIATQERFGKPSGIVQMGKSVGADIVVYAIVDGFSLSPDGQEFAPSARARVKVVDTKSKLRLWPSEQQEWFPVETRVPTKTTALPQNISDRTSAEYELADMLGRDIARVFIEYSPEDVAQRVGD